MIDSPHILHRAAMLCVLWAPFCAAQHAGAPAQTTFKGGTAALAPDGALRVRAADGDVHVTVRPALWVNKKFTAMKSNAPLQVGDVTVACARECSGGDALHVEFVFTCEAFAKIDGVAAVVELPRALFAQGGFAIDGRAAVPFARARVRSGRMFMGPAHRFAISSDSGRSLSLERSPGGLTVLQDASGAARGAYQVQFYARPCRGLPARRRLLSLRVALDGAQPAPAILELHANRAELPRCELFELTARLRAAFDNPFDPADVLVEAHVETPSARALTLRGFYDQAFERVDVAGRDELRCVGRPRWKVRFAPDEVGTYRYELVVSTRNGVARSQQRTFTCTPSDAPGYVRVSADDARRFVYGSGALFAPVGMNVAWTAGGPHPFETYLDALQQAGCTYARVWLCSWDLAFEGRRLDDYQLDTAQRLDELLAAAAARRIAIQLCIDNFLDYTDASKSKRVPYWMRNGGPCRNVREFFEKPEAHAHYRRKLGYLAARYGAYTSLFAWELWNEMDLLTRDRQPQYMIDWTAQMAQHLRTQDHNRHPVSSSLAHREPWGEFWTGSGLDFAQLHPYIYQPELVDEGAQLDAVELILSRAQELGELAMPLLISEFGFMGGADLNPLNDRDIEGLHLHNALWASALGGCAGGAMPWWWDTYVHPTDQYHHLAALAAFLKDLDLASPAWRATTAHISDRGPVRVLGMKTDSQGAFWIQRRGNSWYERLVEQAEPQVLRNVVVRIPNVLEGSYQVQWLDTYTGQIVNHEQSRAAGGWLELKVPAAVPDIALKVRRVVPAR